MVAGDVKSVMGLQKSVATTRAKSDASARASLPTTASSGKPQQSQKGSAGAPFSRSFGVYFPRPSSQVQPDVSELLTLVEQLRDSESRLRTELLEHKLLKESVAIVPVLESVISNKDSEIERYRRKIGCLDAENERLRSENEFLHMELSKQNAMCQEKIRHMQAELADIKRAVAVAAEEDEEGPSSSTSNRKSNVTIKPLIKCTSQIFQNTYLKNEINTNERPKHSEEIQETSDGLLRSRSRAPRVPKPPPRPAASPLSYTCLSDSANCALAEISDDSHPPPPPLVTPPPPAAPPPPPPPPPKRGSKPASAKVRRVPEVAEFYHSLMRRDSTCRKDTGGGGSAIDPQVAGATTKDMIGEIENRSAHLLAIKNDVETQGDFIRFLIKQVEAAAFTDIEDVVSFVKWLDDELSYLVDERAVLKHFDWPEKKADALREAAFGYRDLKKLESQVSLYHDDPRQSCDYVLKKIQSLFNKLEHAVYNLSRMRESAMERYKGFHIPVNWMQDTGYVSLLKLASVRLAVKYMKRVSAELEMAPQDEELIVQGVKFAFRVHQFAGGFDVETMKAFWELRDKAGVCKGHQHRPPSTSALYL